MATKGRQSGVQLGFLIVLILVLGAFTQVAKQPVSADGLFRFSVLNIGQGDALLLDTPHGEHILIDAGPSGDVVGVLARYLTPPQTIRLVIASHNHADHIGGFTAVFDEYPVQEAWISGAVHTTDVYLRWLKAIQGSGAKTRTVVAGVEEVIDGVVFTVLYPLASVEGERLAQEHDGTVVVKASYGALSVLLTGDLEDEHEAALLAHDPVMLGATILKVTHHGSKYATTEAFLDAVHPKVAVISVGADNKFGHPGQQTLDRLAKRVVPVFRTDQQGTIQFTSDGAHLWVQPERGERQEVDILGVGR